MKLLMSTEEIRSRLKAFLNMTPPAPMSPMRTLHALFQQNRELFYNLALEGVGKDAEEELVALASLASRVQKINKGFRVEGEGKAGCIKIYGFRPEAPMGATLPIMDSIGFTEISVEEVRAMCQELYNGYVGDSTGETKRGRMVGQPVSHAAVEFSLRE